MKVKQHFRQNSKKNNIRTFVLVAVIAAALFIGAFAVLDHSPAASAAGDTGTPDTSWYNGTGTYEIGTADELAGLAYIVNNGKDMNGDSADVSGSTITLTADIDLSPYGTSITGWNGGSGWVPIGNNTKQFNGTFDGGNHIIMDLTINTSGNYAGLFGYIGSNGIVENLGVVGGTVSISTSGAYTGGVVGLNYGEVSDCYSTGSVSGIGTGSYVGGVVGYNASGGTIQYCYNTGLVNGYYAGGVVGYNASGGTIQYCYNTGSVSFNGSGRVGGVAGYNGGTVSNCYNTSSVSVSGSSTVGGVIGQNVSGGTVTNCYYNKDHYTLSGIGVNTGTGSAVGLTTAQMTDGGTLDTGGDMYGLGDAFVKMDYGDATNNGCALTFYPELKVFAIGTDDGSGVIVYADDLTKAMSKISVVATTDDGYPLGTNEQYFVYGNGLQDNPYQIWTAQELNHVRNEAHYGTVYFELMYDINLAGWNSTVTGTTDLQTDGNGWVPIGDNMHWFEGVFDGNDHVIQNLNISRSTNYVGLFGDSGGGSNMIWNLGIVGGSVSGGSFVGGVVGSIASGSVTNCYNTGPVSASGTAGGVVGGSGGTVSNCYNTGPVSGGYVGGVVGWHNGGTVSYCYNTGPVSGTTNVGGVIGYTSNNGGTVSYCYNTGLVSASDTIIRVGGVVGYNDASCSVTNCYYNEDNYSGDGIGVDDSLTGDAIGLTTVQMVSSDVSDSTSLIANLPTGSGGFEKRPADPVGTDPLDPRYCYYPELDVFFNGTPQQQTDSQKSVEVAIRTPNVSPSTDPITYGQTLYDSNLRGTATDPDLTPPNDAVDGEFTWETDTFMPQVSDSGLTPYGYTFTPASELYKAVTDETTVEVSALEITVTPDSGQSKVYGTADPELEYTYDPDPVLGDSITGVLGRETGQDVGTYEINLGSLSAGDNYVLTLSSEPVYFTIDPLNITVTPVSGQSKTYNTADPELEYTYDPELLEGDSFTGALGRDPGENVGTYEINLGSLSAGDNYILNFTPGVMFEIVAPSVYYITAASDQNSNITPDGVVAVHSGGSQTFSFSASLGYTISSVTVDGKSIGQDQIALGEYTFSGVISNHLIYVSSVYNPNGNATLSINVVEGKGHADYSFDGGLNFTTYTSAVVIPSSSNIVVEAFADEGYHFVKWGGDSSSTGSEISFGNVKTSLHLDLYFAENGGSAGHSGLLLWVLMLLILIIIVGIIIWYLFYRRKVRSEEDG